jgi:multidrug transporter EmrE-like cation transporter
MLAEGTSSSCRNLFLVAVAGVLLFREKIGAYGIAGIVTGIVSLVLLATP